MDLTVRVCWGNGGKPAAGSLHTPLVPCGGCKEHGAHLRARLSSGRATWPQEITHPHPCILLFCL